MKKPFTFAGTIILFTCFVFLFSPLSAQVGIGTTTPNPSAVLDMPTTTKGLLIPRMSTAQRNAIVSPASGLMILNLDDQCIDIFDGTNWIKNCGMKITGTDTLLPEWTQKANFGGLQRNGSVGFSINGKGYIGTGASGGNYQKDFWEFDPSTNVWTQKANFGGTERAGAVAFVISGLAYVGTGSDINGLDRKDFWQYNPTNNSWVQKANFGGFGRREAVGFALFGQGYVGTGSADNGNSWYKDFWGYDPVSDGWYQMNDFPFYAHSLVGFSMPYENYEFGYVGIGWHKGPLPPLFPNYLDNSFYEFNPAGFGTWTQVTSFPGTSRHNAVSFTVGSNGYVGTGFSTGPVYQQDFWKYHNISNTWTQVASLPGNARVHAVGLTINNKGYVGTGWNGSDQQDFWEYNPYPTGPVYANTQSLQGVHTLNDNIWIKELNKVYNSSAEFAGIGLNTPANKLDISMGPARTGSHATGRPLYITGDILPSSGVEIRHSNGTQGIGIGYNAIYAAGSDPSQGITFSAKGATGAMSFQTNASERMHITGDGKIGIGTYVPTRPLQIQTPDESFGIAHTHGTVDVSTYVSNATGGRIGTVSNHPFKLYANNGSNQFTLMPNGNIGIGTGAPNGKLQFDNGLINRKIVLYESANNEHEYYGFGINGSTLRYQVSNVNDNHVFFSAASTTSSNELMRITGLGKVGLGINNPANKLDINSGAARTGSHASNLAFYVTGAFSSDANGVEFRHDNGTQGIGFGFNTVYASGSNASQDLNLAARGPAGNLVFKTNGNEFFRITGNGNIGLWNSNPEEKLQLGSYGTSSDTYFKVSTTGGNQFKAGIKLRHFNDNYGWTLESDETANLFRIKRHVVDPTGVTAMTIDYGGNVGIEGIINTEAFIAPTLLSGFVNYGNDFATAAYYKDKMGIVHLRGLVSAGNHNGINIFQLPAGYRPSTSGRLIFIALSSTGHSRVDITADGYVVANGSSTGWLNLNGISFRAD